MHKTARLIFFLVFFAAGCEKADSLPIPTVGTSTAPVAQVTSSSTFPYSITLPIQEYARRRTVKLFGEYIQDRFRGYHVGDDVEYGDVKEDVPVVAIADGTIKYVSDFVSGYGGVMIVTHKINDKIFQAIYGHLDLKEKTWQVGDLVKTGDELAVLGDHESRETDRERKHLHFALYQGEEVRLAGYELEAKKVGGWINPQDFFEEWGLSLIKLQRTYEPRRDCDCLAFPIQFILPAGMDVEFIPSLKALNIFSLSGSGTARDRSQIFLRYFDARDFLTLSTVTIHARTDLLVGQEGYEAKRYDIEKKTGVSDFPEQPMWRNGRHSVTDVRKKEGFTRYYVIAANPNLETSLYESFLASLKILDE